MAERLLCVGLLLLGLVGGGGCALHATKVGAPKHPTELLAGKVHEAGWQDLESPFTLDRESLHTVIDRIGRYGTEEERLQRAVRFINSDYGLHFQYAPNLTLTASEAFRERKGDCMTYAALLTAVTRSLGVRSYFVYVDSMPVTYDADGWLYSASHIAVGLGANANRALVVDFVASQAEWTASMYQPVTDVQALTLYYSNRAVERMVQGEAALAERMLRTLMAEQPDVREPYVNLTVALLRQGRAPEALAFAREALQRFPQFPPLWTNAIKAARASGDAARVQQLEAAVETISRTSPTLQYMQGINALRAGDARKAVAHLERAVAGMSAGTLVRGWLVRAYVQAGEARKAGELLARMHAETPDSVVVERLVAEHPVLAAALGPAATPPPAPADDGRLVAARKGKGAPARRSSPPPGDGVLRPGAAPDLR
jgi:tetratricopeptide (TPR) repeat protein